MKQQKTITKTKHEHEKGRKKEEHKDVRVPCYCAQKIRIAITLTDKLIEMHSQCL